MGNDSFVYSTGECLPLLPQNNICEVIDRQALLSPSAPAVIDGLGSLSYLELSQQSTRWALHLRALGLESGDIVAVMLPRCKEFPLHLFAIMKAGGTYLPLDVNYPYERLDYMIKHSRAKVLITTRELFLSNPFYVKQVVFAEESVPSDTSLSLPVVTGGQSAYVIYTSGSTGRPRGVVISHRSLLGLISWFAPRVFDATAQDRFCAVNSFSFDASVVDLFPPLAVGASVHIIPDMLKNDLPRLRQYIIHHKLTLGIFTTRFGAALLDDYDLPFRAVMLAGEKLNAVPRTSVRIINGYGPTEFTVCSSYYCVRGDEVEIPIGRPTPNSCSYVVNDRLELLPVGEVGELCLAGIQIAEGYINDSERTDDSFVPNPYAVSDDYRRMYRTGDLVRWNHDGQLEYMGRKDMQVKVRGYRVELSEIESALKSYPGIKEAVATVTEVGTGQHICGYYVCNDAVVDETALKQYLSEKLPSYQLPGYLYAIPSVPLTVNGKLDPTRLPVPRVMLLGEEPASSDERVLLDLAVLLMEEAGLGVTDDLFAAGMDSITAIRFAAGAGEQGIGLNVTDLYEQRTVRRLVENLGTESPVLHWVNADRSKPLVVLVSGATPPVMLEALVKGLQPHFSILQFNQITEQYPGNESRANYKAWIEMYLTHLQQQLRPGQEIYAFAGHCLGGEFAFSLAARWRETAKGSPQVWVFNSTALRQTEKTDYLWTLSSDQKVLFDRWMGVAYVANQLVEQRQLPVYDGPVTFFYARRFTPNLLLPELPPMTTDPDELELLYQGELQNIEDWKLLAPRLNIFSVEATHWTLFAPENLRLILDYLTQADPR